MLGTQWHTWGQSRVPEQWGEFPCTSLFTPYWTPLSYIIRIFNLKAYEAKLTENEGTYISLWTDILWTLRVLVLMHAYFITMKTSSADQSIKPGLVYLFYCHDHDSEKPTRHLVFSTLVYYIWSMPLAFDLWIKWKYIREGVRASEYYNPFVLKWNTNSEINMNIKIFMLCVIISIWFLIFVSKEL